MSTTIYVGNIQSIKDEQLHEYFQRFGTIESLYHNCRRAADEWLIDYRFIRFSSDTDMSNLLTNKVDHTICRIRLDIHSYDVAFRDDTRLISDRKICITHTNPQLARNVVRDAFRKYGKILNCTCVSSGHGVEHAYIEYELINHVQAVFNNKKQHFVGKTPVAVKKPLRPSEVGIKDEQISINKQEFIEPQRPRANSHVDTAQYSSFLVSQSNFFKENHRTDSLDTHSQQKLKDYEQEYNMIICQDFDEITYQVDAFLRNQKQSYRKLRHYIRDELKTRKSKSSSSESEDGEISSSSDSERSKSTKSKKRLKSNR